MTEIRRCFELLGVSPEVSPEEVKRAYYDLVREWHPDRLQHDPGLQRAAEARLKEINVAYGRVRAYYDDPAVPPHLGPGRNGTRTAHGAQDPLGEQRRRDRARALHLQGEAAFMEGRWREAVDSLLKSVCLIGKNPQAYYTLGLAYRVQNEPGRAASAFRQVVRLQPERGDAFRQLAQVYLQMGDHRETLAACAQSLRLNAPDTELLTTMGSAYRLLNRRSQALDCLGRALNLNPRSAEARYELGMTLLEAGNSEAARLQAAELRGLSGDHAARLIIAISEKGKRKTWFK